MCKCWKKTKISTKKFGRLEKCEKPECWSVNTEDEFVWWKEVQTSVRVEKTARVKKNVSMNMKHVQKVLLCHRRNRANAEESFSASSETQTCS